VPRRLTWAELVRPRQSFPIVVRFKDGTSMVAVRCDTIQGATYLSLEDPHAGRDAPLVLDRLRFEAIWSGDVLFVRRLYQTVDDTVPFGFEMITRLVLAHRRVLGEVALATFMLSVLALSPVMFLRLVMGRVLQYKSVDTLVMLSLLMLAVVAIETGFGALKRYLADRLATKVEVRLWVIVFNRVLRLPIEYFETVPPGETLHRIRMLSRVRDSLLVTVLDAGLDVGVLIVFIPVMMLISLPLTGLVLLTFALTVFWVFWTLPSYRDAASAAEAAETRKGTFLFQNLAGIRTVKTLALDARQRRDWEELVENAKGFRLTEGRITTQIEAVLTVLQRLMIVATMIGGTYLAMTSDESVSITTLFTFVLLAQRAAAPLNQAANLIQQYDQARTAVQDVASLYVHAEEEGRSGNGLRTPLQGHVAFDKLLFKYRGAVTPALKSISFEVPAGMTLGIMGRSGSGKTTITRLLQRLHSDYQGVIRMDGVDIRDYDIDHLRSSLGVVLQENFLFSGTIRDNITVAKTEASFEEVVQAARLAGAEEFIDRLPRGYDTYIYEGSPNLSGGQRQRLAIARALITNPKLLILDEATSALDAESEAIVNANLKRIAHGRTMIVVSHRLSALVNADAIMVLDRGEVVDIGRHNELLDRCDIYSSLWYHQNPTADEGIAA
jgi:subfamily B ATP-binding cassette protein HlyB/CyaB